MGNGLYQSPPSKNFTCSPLTSRDYVPLCGDFMPVYQNYTPVHQDLTPVLRDLTPVHRDLTLVYQDSIPVHQDSVSVYQYSTPVYRDSTPVNRELIPACRNFVPASQDLPIVKDVSPLTFLQKMKNRNQRLLRWSLLLQEYNLNLTYIKGRDNIITDATSRSE